MLRNHRGFPLLLLFFLTIGCEGAEEPPPLDVASGVNSLVVTSIFPIGDLTRQLIGEVARVEVLLPPGASPATFDLAPKQLRDFQNAKVFFMIGGGLDEWVSVIPPASNRESTLVRLSDDIPLLAEEEEEEEGHGHHEGSGNPHVWLDPVLVRDEILPKLEESLVRAFPAAKEAIAARGRLLADSLTSLDGEIRQALQPVQGRGFISTHSAWTYFAARYGLVEAGVIHAHPGQEPSSRELAELLDVARTHGITCLFTEPQLGEMAAVALASELSLPTCLLDPLGGENQEGREGYFQLMRFNTQQLLGGLGGIGS